MYKTSYVTFKHEFLFSPMQVSYIIMNGTTWDLEVKGIKRTKRDVARSRQGTPHLSSGHLVIPFIDTRRFPRNVQPPRRARASRWVNRMGAWRSNNHSRRLQSIRHLRGAARSRALEGQAPRHVRRKLHDRARLRSRRMRGGRARLSRETTLDSELQRDFGRIVQVRQSTDLYDVKEEKL